LTALSIALGSHLSELNAVIETLTKGLERVANFGSGLDIQLVSTSTPG
jgi:hypothetical protein